MNEVNDNCGPDEGWGGDSLEKVAEQKVQKFTEDLRSLTERASQLLIDFRTAQAALPYAIALKHKDLKDHALLQIAAQRIKEVLEELQSMAEGAFDMQRKSILPKLMDDSEMDLIRLPGVGRVELRHDAYVTSVKPDGPPPEVPPPNGELPKGYLFLPELDDDGNEVEGTAVAVDYKEWLARNGLGDLIQDTVNASSLKAAIKKKQKDGVIVPTELFNVTPNSFAVVIGGK